MTRGSVTPAQAAGSAAEEAAARFLERNGLAIVARNYRTRQGEIDLIAREGATLVFVEVRMRSSGRYGGGAESIGWRKRSRIEAAARQYLSRLRREPACRFDVVTLDGGIPVWLRGAFEAREVESSSYAGSKSLDPQINADERSKGKSFDHSSGRIQHHEAHFGVRVPAFICVYLRITT